MTLASVTPAKIVGALVLIRGLWATFNHLSMVLYRFGVANLTGIDGHMAALIFGASLWLMVPLFAFSLGYVVAGILVIRSHWWAVIVYAAAFLIDASVWAGMTMMDGYGAIYGGNAAFVDMLFNLFDLIVLTYLAVWGFRHRTKAQTSNR